MSVFYTWYVALLFWYHGISFSFLEHLSVRCMTEPIWDASNSRNLVSFGIILFVRSLSIWVYTVCILYSSRPLSIKKSHYQPFCTAENFPSYINKVVSSLLCIYEYLYINKFIINPFQKRMSVNLSGLYEVVGAYRRVINYVTFLSVWVTIRDSKVHLQRYAKRRITLWVDFILDMWSSFLQTTVSAHSIIYNGTRN